MISVISKINNNLRAHKLLLLLLICVGIGFSHMGLANADYGSIPKIKQPIDSQTGLYDESVKLDAGTNNPWTGAGAAVPQSFFKLWTNSPGAARAISITVMLIDTNPGACSGYGIVANFQQPTSDGQFSGSGWSPGQEQGVTNCGITWSVTIPPSAWIASSIPGQGGDYFAIMSLTIDDSTHHDISNLRIDTSATSPDTHIGYQQGGYSTIFPQVNSSKPDNGLHNISVPFAPICGTAPNGQLTWGDDDQGTPTQPADAGMAINLIVTNLATGGTSTIALANNSINGFSHSGSRSYGPPPGGWQTDYSYTLQFTNVAGGNGIWFSLPFDEGNAYTPCPQPHSANPACYALQVNDPGAGNQTLARVWDSENNTLIPNVQPISNPSTFYDPPRSHTESYDGDGGTASDGDPTYTQVGTPLFIVNHGGQGKWSYTVRGQNVNVLIINRTHNSDGTWTTTSYNQYTFPCNGGSIFNPGNGQCSISVSGDGPNGVVRAGGPMYVNAVVYNTGPGDLPDNILGHPLQLNNGDSGPGLTQGSDWGFSQSTGGIPYGGATGVSFTLTAPGSSTPYTKRIAAHPAYSSLFDFGPGSGCGINVNVYAPFSLTAQAQVTLLDDTGAVNTEAPTKAVNTTYVDETGAPVSEHVTSNLYENTACGINLSKGSTFNDGPFNPGTRTYLYNPSTDAAATYATCATRQAGDTYCANIQVPTASGGYVGPGGDIVGGSSGQSTSCPNVVNKPYFKAFNGGVSAGGSFSATSGGTCGGGGTLASWNNDTGTNPTPTSGDFGASAQLNALALKNIVGFASAQPPFGQSPTYLTFANNSSPTSDAYSPSLGGAFDPLGNGYCLTDEAPSSGSQQLTGTPGNPVHINDASPTTVNLNTDQSIFVTGDAYIANNIVYNGSGGSWSLSGPNRVPRFTLHATGNIYISPGVSELDGLYISQGKIYTCANSGGNGPMAATDLYAQCGNQLTIYGNFVANQVNLMRTFGSLRDETPATPPGTPGATNPLAWSCGGGICNPNLAGDNCVAISEPGEPAAHTWTDNHLCTSGADTSAIKLGWTDWAGSPYNDPSSLPFGLGPGRLSLSYYQTHGYPDCTPWNPVNNSPYNYPAAYGWSDNYLCSNVPVRFYAGPHTAGSSEYCTAVTEPSDTDGNNVWNSSTICIDRSIPTVPPSPPVLSSCSNWDGAAAHWLSRQTCAAEVFSHSPEMYLSPPPPPTSGSSSKWDAVTSLPPVL